MAGQIIQSVYAVDDSGGTATTIAVAINGVANGSHVVAHAGWSDSGAVTATCSDGVSYSTADPRRNDATNGQSGQVFIREGAIAGNYTVTVTLSVTRDFRRLRVYEVANLKASGSVDQSTGQSQITPGTGANAVSSGASAATTTNNCFVMGFSQNVTEIDPGTGTVTAGTNYTISGSNLIMCGEGRSVSVIGAQTATFTQSINNTRITHVVAFREAVSGPWARNIANPGKHPGRRKFGPIAKGYAVAAANPDVTVALTGQAYAWSAGPLTPSTTVALTGSQYAWSAGTTTPATTLALAGSLETYAAGTLTPSTTIALTGAQYTWNTGTISASTGGDVTVALTGQAYAWSAGTLAPSTTVALTGAAEAYSAGTVAVDHAQSLSGAAEAYSSGSLTPSTTISLNGELYLYSTGALTAQAGGDVTVALAGIQYGWQAGTMAAEGGDVQDTNTPGRRSRLHLHPQFRGETEEQKRRRRIEQGIIQVEKAEANILPAPAPAVDIKRIHADIERLQAEAKEHRRRLVESELHDEDELAQRVALQIAIEDIREAKAAIAALQEAEAAAIEAERLQQMSDEFDIAFIATILLNS